MNLLGRVYNEPSAGGRWFLLCLYECCLFLFILVKIKESLSRKIQSDTIKKIIRLILLLVFVICWNFTWLFGGFSSVLGLNSFCNKFVYYVAGYYINKFCNENAYGQCRWKNLIYIAFPCLVPFWDRIHYVSFYSELNLLTGGSMLLKMVATEFEFVYYYLVSFLGIAFMWSVAKLIQNTTAVGVLSGIGMYTMEIYILHQYMWVTCFEVKWANALLSFILGFCIPVIIAKIVHKEKHLSCILFGTPMSHKSA